MIDSQALIRHLFIMQYQEDKGILKELIKTGKVLVHIYLTISFTAARHIETYVFGQINVTSMWTFDMFKDAITEAGDVATVDESNFQASVLECNSFTSFINYNMYT
jgi:hypothetical protein